MSHEERQAFLADLHVGLLSVADGDRGPLAVPIWYAYEPGASCASSPGAIRARAACWRAPGA